ncbi:hypothetical protein [Glutamicibacter nicotianae]|uniref:hypothetical protein n=1 Tax=Glutamicibacter nicotianae TaxID=37929 RepID=UPI0013CE74E9|nr:hypothetical protein [Glutamicibacter nicotianae]
MSQSTQLEAQLAAQQIVINNLRQWLSDTQLQLAEAVANVHLKDQMIQQLQNEDPTE